MSKLLYTHNYTQLITFIRTRTTSRALCTLCNTTTRQDTLANNHHLFKQIQSSQLLQYNTNTQLLTHKYFSSSTKSTPDTEHSDAYHKSEQTNKTEQTTEQEEEDVTANARANSDRTTTQSILYKWLRRLIIITLIVIYPYSVLRYNLPLPAQNYVIQDIIEHGDQSKYWGLLKVYIMSSNFLTHFITNTELLNKLIELLQKPEISVQALSTKTDIITLFYAICMQPDYDLLREHLASINGLTRALLTVAMSNDVDKDTSAYAFSTVSKLILSKQARDEFVACKGLQQCCRATRARAPEVANAATEVLTNLLIEFPNVKQLQCTPNELNNIFMCVANLAAMFQENNQHEAAISAFKQALAIDSANTAIMSQIGSELHKIGLDDEAITYYRKALKLDPSHIDSAFYLSKLLVGKDLKQGTEVDSQKLQDVANTLSTAIDTYNTPQMQQQRQSTEQSPLLSSAYNLLIRTYEQLTDYSSALEYAADWTLRSPADAIAHYTYGRLLGHNKRTKDGLKELSLAQKFDPSRPDIDYQIAVLHYKNKQFDLAKQALDKCVFKYMNETKRDATLIDKVNILDAKLKYAQNQPTDALRILQTVQHPSIESTLLYIKLAQQVQQTDILYQQQTLLCQQLQTRQQLLKPAKQNQKIRNLVKSIQQQCHMPSDSSNTDYKAMCEICSTLKLS